MIESRYNDEYYEDTEEKVVEKAEPIMSYWKAIGCLLLILLTIFNFTSIITFVPTESMANEIQPNDILYASKIPYITGDPDRFDIIVFRYPLQEDTLYIKRIIGLPGEHVEIKGGHVYINGQGPLVENYLPEEWIQFNNDYTFDVPNDSYLVLGDNRNHSYDARFWREEALKSLKCSSDISAEKYAYVKKSNILGQALTKISPTFEVLK